MREELQDILNAVQKLSYSEPARKAEAIADFVLKLTKANLNKEELTIVVYELLNNHKCWVLNELLPDCDKDDINFDYRQGDKLSMFEQVCYDYDELDEDVLNIFLKNISDKSINESMKVKKGIYSWQPASVILIAKRKQLLGK